MSTPDKMEIVPITDQVSEKVREAVDELERENPPDSSAAPPEPPDLELGEASPASIGEVMQVPSERWLAVKRMLRRATKALVVVAVLGAVAAAFLAFTETGRSLLPPSMQKDAKQIARQVDQRVRGSDEVFYTFTDDQGVVHIVDHLDKVPKQYRSRAKQSR